MMGESLLYFAPEFLCQVVGACLLPPRDARGTERHVIAAIDSSDGAQDVDEWLGFWSSPFAHIDDLCQYLAVY